MRFESGRECIGTGWLIDVCTIATAGHNVYCALDGYAADIQVDIGYHGNEHVDLESRRGKHIAVHWGWRRNELDKYDLAFIRVGEPFENVEPIPWKVSPVIGNDILIEVVGYPRDVPDGEEGQYMYVSKGYTSYNLESSNFMLEYTLDTKRGTWLYY
jgi:V8-like Glu-specific endopeptidase